MKNPFDNLPLLYFTIAANGTFAEVNRTFCQKTGYRREDLIGQKADRIFSIATRIFQQTHLFPLLQMQEYAEEIYIDLQTKAGETLPLLINVKRTETDGNTATVYAGIVVHNRKKFEDELIAAKKAAEKAVSENSALLHAKQALQESAQLLDRQMSLVRQQNEELRQINRAVTHDLQEPLRKLFLFTNRLLETNDEYVVGDTVQKIKAASEKMRAVIQGLQQYVWLTEAPLEKRPVNLHEQLQSIGKTLKEENPAVTITLVAEELPVPEGDAEQIRFLLLEILRNAVRFRKPGQEVTIEVTATGSMQNSFVAIPEKYQYEAYVKLHFKDNGTGFDATYKDQVFELFKRLHPESGPGVGLALCKKIAENHQGNIAIYSTPGEGTTVSVSLPLCKQDQLPVSRENEVHTGKFTDPNG